MKYTCELTIELPRKRVVELFDNPDNLAKWLPGLQSFEHLSGEMGQPGATSRLIFEERGRRVEMIETVVTRNLPDEFTGTYEAKGMKNLIANHFYEEGPQETRWEIETEFTFSGSMKLFSPFMRKAFPKQTLNHMTRFKEFAESS
ncbi:MAG: SRPBCC family protein [Bacteroidetes bacterium]|nr:SRPBCC family protein [Bacteroidota bacterium]